MSETEPTTTGRPSGGCLAIAAVFVLLLVLLGAVAIGELLSVFSTEDEPAAQSETSAPGTGTPPATTAGGCLDDIAAFRTYAGARADAQPAVLDHVTLVCWQPAGELRAEATYAGDINATSAGMVWLCRALSGFVTGSGRTWHGFTVYSTSAATPGRAFLAGPTEGGACTNPLHAAGG